MLERLVRWSLENRVVVYAIAILLTAFGAWTASRTLSDVAAGMSEIFCQFRGLKPVFALHSNYSTLYTQGRT